MKNVLTAAISKASSMVSASTFSPYTITPSDLLINIGKEIDKDGKKIGPDRFEIRKGIPGVEDNNAASVVLAAYDRHCRKHGKPIGRRSAREFIQANPWIHDAKKV